MVTVGLVKKHLQTYLEASTIHSVTLNQKERTVQGKTTTCSKHLLQLRFQSFTMILQRLVEHFSTFSTLGTFMLSNVPRALVPCGPDQSVIEQTSNHGTDSSFPVLTKHYKITTENKQRSTLSFTELREREECPQGCILFSRLMGMIK